MANIIIDQNIVYGIGIIAAISTFALIGLIFFIFSNSVFKTILIANLKKRPIIQIHTSLKQTKIFSGIKSGKQNNANVYNVPEFGIKFTPLPEMVEHIGASRHINYYSKGAFALSSKAIAAFRDVENLLKIKGIIPNETILDVLLIMTDEEIKDLYNLEVNTLQNDTITLSSDEIIDIRNELQNTFIKDGQFVWETARSFISLLQTETSRSLDEYIAIVREQALSDAKMGLVDRTSMQSIIIIITLLMGGAIAFKILSG